MNPAQLAIPVILAGFLASYAEFTALARFAGFRPGYAEFVPDQFEL